MSSYWRSSLFLKQHQNYVSSSSISPTDDKQNSTPFCFSAEILLQHNCFSEYSLTEWSQLVPFHSWFLTERVCLNELQFQNYLKCSTGGAWWLAHILTSVIGPTALGKGCFRMCLLKNYCLKNKDPFPTSTDKKVEQTARGDHFPLIAPQNPFPWQIGSSVSRKCSLQFCPFVSESPTWTIATLEKTKWLLTSHNHKPDSGLLLMRNV